MIPVAVALPATTGEDPAIQESAVVLVRTTSTVCGFALARWCVYPLDLALPAQWVREVDGLPLEGVTEWEPLPP